jgi:alpha-1,6-mannosyltransferase
MIRFKRDDAKFYWTAVVLSIILTVELLFHQFSPTDGGKTSSYIRRGLEYTLLNVIYFAWLIRRIRERQTVSLPRSGFETAGRVLDDSESGPRLLPSSIFLALSLISYPVTADVYLYLQYGLMCLNGVNPYTHRAGDFASALTPHLHWAEAANYGPIQLGVVSLLASFLPLGIFSAVYILKGFCLALHVLNAHLIGRVLKGSSYRGLAAFAYLVNPILLFEQVVNAHLDVLSCTLLILMLLFLKRKNDEGATVANWASVYVKAYAIVWVPIYFAYLLRNRRWASLAMGVLLWVATIVGLTLTLFPNGEAWARLQGPGKWMAAGSLHDIFSAILDGLSGVLPEIVVRKKAGIVLMSKLASYLGFCLFYAWLLWRFFFVERGTEEALSRGLGWATLLLFLLATPWFQPWYATVLIPFVVINRDDRLFAITAAAFATLATTSYYVFAYASVRGPLLVVSLLTVGPPIALIALGLLAPRLAERSWSWLMPSSGRDEEVEVFERSL